MAFDLDLKNWAIDFDLQDRAETWCKEVASSERRPGLSWPPSGELGLREAFLEGVPHYLLAYSHRTAPSTIQLRLAILAGKETFTGASFEEVCAKYQVTFDEVIEAMNRRAAANRKRQDY